MSSLDRRVRRLEERMRPPEQAPSVEEVRAALLRRFARIEVKIGISRDGETPDVLVGDSPEQQRRDADVQARWQRASGSGKIRRDEATIQATRQKVRRMLSLPPEPEEQEKPDPPLG